VIVLLSALAIGWKVLPSAKPNAPRQARSADVPIPSSPDPAPPAPGYAGRKILYVDSYHAEYPHSQRTLQGVRFVLRSTGVELRTFYMDTKRNASEKLGAVFDTSLLKNAEVVRRPPPEPEPKASTRAGKREPP
jgi:hypothetical protein